MDLNDPIVQVLLILLALVVAFVASIFAGTYDPDEMAEVQARHMEKQPNGESGD